MARKKFRKFILHIGPTNSGKTHEAMKRLKEVGAGIYLAPLRLLAYEQYERLNESGYPCSLITGEEASIQPGANIQASTIEMVSVTEPYQVAVIDEAQMVADPSRGGAWTKAILGLNCREIHVCMSPSAEKIITNLITECGDEYEIIRHERQVPLVVDKKHFSFPKDVEKNDALIVFSKKNVHAVANELKEKGIKSSIIYGNLPYDVRQNEARKFQNGETEVVVATDAIGMGLNLPIRRVVFLEDSKYDGVKTRTLTPEEFQQIAGRAGRMGMFEEGYCLDASYSDLMKSSIKKSVPEITTAIIGFPEQLIGIDAKLSEIIEQWDHIPVINGYKHSDSSELFSRAKELEKYTANKLLIYNFITIPFSENSSAKDLWKKCFLAEKDKKSYTFKKMCKDFSISPVYDTISELEEVHKYCDIAYAYAYKFGYTKEIAPILDMKKQISEKIMELLKKQKLEPRKCKYCGKMLPWNYSYGMCSECHDAMYPRRNNRNYYNEWDDDDWEDNEWDDGDDLW